MLIARCKKCRKEILSTSKIQCCGCPNMMTVVDDRISAVDLGEVVLVTHEESVKYRRILTDSDLKYQEERRKRKVRRLDYDVK